MILINKISELKKYRQFIDKLFAMYGKTYFHHYSGIESALIQNKDNDYYVVIDADNQIVTAFEKKSSSTWECCFKGFPFLVSAKIDSHKIEDFLIEVKSALGASTLFFPLVYRTDFVLSLFKNNNLYFTYDRLANQIIKPPFDQQKVWQRVKYRYGSRAERQKKKFEQNLHTKLFTKTDVKDMLSTVETNSWKRLYKQDMLSRENQIGFYNNLIKSGLAEIVFAYDETNLPVAFRIDTRINGVLYVLKWSYDNNFKKYSPGFYLLTVDLFRRRENTKYKYIDLYGSLDSLKALVRTNELRRIDLIFSDSREEIKKISEEKKTYDLKVLNNYKNNNGIQKLFKPG